MNKFQSSSPKTLALLIAIIITIVDMFIMSLYFFNVFEDVQVVDFLSFSALLVFTISFILVYFALNSFILKRIAPIYKTIDAIKIPQIDLYDKIEDIDIISELKSEVMTWAKIKTKEIEQLKYNEKFRKEFIGNVAHELKTPVFNIQGYVLTLLDGALEDKSLAEKYLKRTAKNVKRMIALITDVDTISRLEAGDMILEYSVFSLCDLINEVIELQEIKQSNFNVKVVFKEHGCKKVFIKADREKILEVINNLVANSLKYGKSGGITRITLKQELSKIFVSIADNGIGIGEEHLPRIFERFYRVDKSRSRDRGGSGLGLAIVKHIIEAHQQHITVESKLGNGTKFIFSLQKAKNINV
ncbi:MAG: sensor histidine kinase [Bacteroidales bacterium]|nr:sensor histidine kinase [Bacteroidales bacterium]